MAYQCPLRICQRGTLVLGQLAPTGAGIMVSKDGKYRTARDIRLQHVVDGPFSVHCIIPRLLILPVVRNQVACINAPCKLIIAGLIIMSGTSQGRDGLQSGSYQEVRAVAFEGSIKGCRNCDFGGRAPWIWATAQTAGTIGFGANCISRIDMHITQVQDFDSLTAWFGNGHICRLWSKIGRGVGW